MRPVLAFATLFICLPCALALAADDAAELLKVIQSNESSDADRANAFQKIGDIAGADVVEPLTSFLSDSKWSHYARVAFQKMEGRNVTLALLRSLDVVQGELQLGVIDTLGRRRDPIAIAPLAGLMTHSDLQVVAAAAVALGEIGTPAAAAVLGTVLSSEKDPERRQSLSAALLLIGQRLAKTGNAQAAIAIFDRLRSEDVPKSHLIGATHNAILVRGAQGVDLMVEQLKSRDRDFFQTGLTVSRVLPGGGVTRGITDSLDTESSPDRQVLLIFALKDRGDHRALAAILEKIRNDEPTVQRAAIAAISALGDESSVPVLLSVADDANADAVLGSLVALRGSDVNRALIQAAEPPNTSTVAIRALGQRRSGEAVDLLFRLAAAESAAISQEAIVALGKAVSPDRFLDLFALLKTAENRTRKAAVQEAIHAAVFRSTQPDACAEVLGTMIPGSSGPDREFLFEQVRTAGGAKAVSLMQEFATGADETLQDAATKTLGRWLSADAAPVLLQVAQGRGKFANRALAGYIRIFRQFEVPETERVAMAAKALQVARRSNERNAAIEAMNRFPCIGTFEQALQQLDVLGSEATAASTALTIARTVLDLDPETARAGLRRLIGANVSRDITESAKVLLQ